MSKSTYMLINKFDYCGKGMVTVIIEGRAACVMPEDEYNRIIKAERKFNKTDRLMTGED